MKGKELHDAILYQAERLISVPLSEVVLDWDVVGGRKGTGDKPPAQYVLVAAVPREIVDRYVRIAKQAELTLMGLEAEPFSLVRSANRIVKGTYAVLDFGGHRSSLVIAEEGTVRSVEDIELTGSKLTTALAKSLVVEDHRAEEMKREHGLVAEGGVDLKRTLGPFLDGLVSDLRSVFSEYVRKYESPVESLLLSGGASQLRAFDSYLADHFEVPVTPLTSLREIQVPDTLGSHSESLGKAYAIAVGLALRQSSPTKGHEG